MRPLLTTLLTDVQNRDNSFAESLRSAFSQPPTSANILLLIAAIVVLSLLVLLIARLLPHPRESKPKPVLDHLAVAVDVMGLSERDRRLLIDIALRAELEQPAAMLLTPRLFASAAARGAATSEARARIAELCPILFGVELPALAAEPEAG